MRAAWVAVPVPSLDPLTYRVPDPLPLPVPGARVLVPVGARVMTGCVVRVDAECEEGSGATPVLQNAPAGIPVARGVPAERQAVPANDSQPETAAIRDLVEVLDERPFLPRTVLDLALWVADYYACGAGEAISAAMPPFAWVASTRRVRLTDSGRAAHAGEAAADLGPLQQAVLRTLAGGRPRLPAEMARVLGVRAASLRAALAALERRGFVAVEQVLRGRADAFKTVSRVNLTVTGEEAIRGGEAAPALRGRQREVLELLAGAPAGLAVPDLRGRGISSDIIRRLADRGYVTSRRERVERDPFRQGAPGAWPNAAAPPRPDPGAVSAGGGEVAPASNEIGDGGDATWSDAVDRLPGEVREAGAGSGRTLSDEQAAALAHLEELAARGGFEAALVHGVTGSGKTEIYVRLASTLRARGRRTLVLVPEIALTPVLAATFRAEFGERVAILHSGLSDGERHDQWHRVRDGEVDVVVGTRSAVFAPLPQLGAIVVDEEHDGSYKQEEAPRYNGRDVAVMRAKREGALVVLGSATPAVETYHNAATGRYHHLTLGRRVLDRPLATVHLVNMRDEYARSGPDLIFSEPLEQAIAGRLARAEQVLVLLNRRGFATAVFCRQCGGTVECPNCSVSLTVHTGAAWRARCHYCNYSVVVPKTCPACAAPYLEQVGLGTQRIEREAARLFPGARIGRLDRDVLQRRGAAADLLARFGAGDVDLLIGTQMVAKGHDFPRVTLVGVISADVGLGLPDFRAAERTFQLLTQVVGRAGRGEVAGEAVIQTLYPDHYSVRHACRQDYPAFFDEEIRYRRALRYPPVVSLVNALVRGPDFRTAFDDATDLAERVRAGVRGRGEVRVLGPAPAPLGRLKGEHRVQFFVKGPSRAGLREALKAALAVRADLARRVTIDVDPMSVL